MEHTHRIKLIHPETEKIYWVTVNEENKNKIEKDINYAQKFFNQVIIKYENEEETFDTKEDFTHEDINVDSADTQHNQFGTSTKGYWTYNETTALITSVESRYEEMYHHQKRKYMWQNVSNDMANEGYEFLAAACYKKWHNLLRTYKSCKDLKQKTGRETNRFLYYDRIDEILSDKPKSSRSRSIVVSSLLGNHPSTSSTSKNIIAKCYPSNKDISCTRNALSSPEDSSICSSNVDSSENKLVAKVENSSENASTSKNHSTSKIEKRKRINLLNIKSNYYKRRWAENHNAFLLNLKLKIDNDNKKLKLYKRKLDIKEKKLELEERWTRALEELVKIKKNA